jgi:hypothetical protein
MKQRNCKRNDGKNGKNNCKNNWMSVAIAGAAMLAATVCGGCLYTIVPAMAGPSTTYPQAANQSNQNKQQTGMPPNGAQPQGQGGTL